MNGKTFKVKYYEYTVNESGEMYKKVNEDDVEAQHFQVIQGIAMFKNNLSQDSLIAAYGDFISVKEVK